MFVGLNKKMNKYKKCIDCGEVSAFKFERCEYCHGEFLTNGKQK